MGRIKGICYCDRMSFYWNYTSYKTFIVDFSYMHMKQEYKQICIIPYHKNCIPFSTLILPGIHIYATFR